METRKGELHVYCMFTYFLWTWPDIWHLIWTEMMWPSTMSFFNLCSPDQSSWSWYLEVLSLPGTTQLIKLTQNQHLQTMFFSFPQRLKAYRERVKMIKNLTYFHLNLSSSFWSNWPSFLTVRNTVLFTACFLCLL